MKPLEATCSHLMDFIRPPACFKRFFIKLFQTAKSDSIGQRPDCKRVKAFEPFKFDLGQGLHVHLSQACCVEGGLVPYLKSIELRGDLRFYHPNRTLQDRGHNNSTNLGIFQSDPNINI